MKIQAKKIQVVLGLMLLTQIGCHGGNHGQGQGYLYPNIATQQQDHSAVGDAFASNQQTTRPGWANLVAGMRNPDGTPIIGGGCTPGSTGCNIPADPKDPNAKTKKGDGTDGTGDGTGDETDSPAFKVELPSKAKWKQDCLDLLPADSTLKRNDPLNKDTDGDAIPDRCETLLAASKNEMYIGLDPAVFNGALVAVKKFVAVPAGLFGNKTVSNDKEGKSILLTEKEYPLWKKNKKLQGGNGSGVDSRFDREIVRKLLARGVVGGSDNAGIRDLMSLVQPEDEVGKDFTPYFAAFHDNQIAHRGINNGLQGAALKNADGTPQMSNGAQKKSDDLTQYALVRNDFAEMIPFPISSDGSSIGSLSGMQKDMVKSLRSGEEFMYVAETHLVVPDGVQLRVGNLVSDRTKALAGSKAGMFFVIHDNNTDIITTDLVHNNLTDADVNSTQGIIAAPSNCMTTHLVIAYLSDTKKAQANVSAKTMFSENVFYAETGKSGDDVVWKPIPQEWMRLKAMDLNSEQQCKMNKDDVVFQDFAEKLAEATPGQ